MLNASPAPSIDRKALVTRHNVELTSPDALNPLSVGNGEFAFTVDITGLQTFDDFHEAGMPLGTQSQWAWHSFRNPENYTLKDVEVLYQSGERRVPYYGALKHQYGPEVPPRVKAAFDRLRCNPHRIDLGRLGLVLRGADGSNVRINDLTKTRQTLDLWQGMLDSHFHLGGNVVEVKTVVHPTLDAVGVRIRSKLLPEKRVGLSLRFPGPCAQFRKAYDWTIPNEHRTTMQSIGRGCVFERRMDETRYAASLNGSSAFEIRETSPHSYAISCDEDAIEFVLHFVPDGKQAGELTFDECLSAAATQWESFWMSGGAVDLSGSTHPQAKELDRRIVLSQYLTAIHCAGSTPPQETGLVCNSWFGKFHLEMHWWHAAHFPLWGRAHLLEKSMGWYYKVLSRAKAKAELQGYRGARWGKMLAADGRDTPSDVGEFLVWQQPHPIYYAELLYRANPSLETLQRYLTIVTETADFMASFARLEDGKYHLGPPVIAAQETNSDERHRLLDPTYELVYWHWALKRANEWRGRLNLPRSLQWDEIADIMQSPLIRDGVYQGIAVEPFQSHHDHPAHLMILGWLPPTNRVDRQVLLKTYEDVQQSWDWPSTWGWDYPVMAMCATRLGLEEQAFDALLMNVQKNTYLKNGHNYQDARLPLYLPGNGGLLFAIAMLAGGCDKTARPQSGVRQFGPWTIRYEGILPAIA